LKPDNVLVDGRVNMKLADFGLARAVATVSAVTPAVGAGGGTPGYMAPEYMATGKLKKNCDIFSLAMLNFEILTGQRPFGHKQHLPLVVNAAVEHNERPVLPQILPQNLKTLFARMWHHRSSERPRARQVLDELQPSSESEDECGGGGRALNEGPEVRRLGILFVRLEPQFLVLRMILFSTL
jgi:eukaryotic-like serine/threonine-protein kinase